MKYWQEKLLYEGDYHQPGWVEPYLLAGEYRKIP